MTTTPDYRAGRLAWRFTKSGGSGHRIQLFVSLPDESRQRLQVLLGPRQEEVPALGAYSDDANWMALTSERLVWTIAGRTQAVELDDLADATVDAPALLRGKEQLRVLTLVLRSGARLTIELEPGPPFSGVWNALKMAAGWGDEVKRSTDP